MRYRLRLVALLGAVALSACSHVPQQADNFYNLPPALAFDRLSHADITGFRNARQCGMLIYFNATPDAPRSITWTVSSGGIAALWFRVNLVPSGAGTVVTIDIPKTRDGGEFYDAEQEYKHPLLMQPLRSSLRELVDAAMAGRAYDWQRIAPPLNSGGICGSLKQNFEASGIPYDIHDPFGMTHEQAEDARQKGQNIPVEPDPVPGSGDGGMANNPWSKS